MLDRMTVSAVARELGLSWDTVNTIAIDATQTIVAADTHRLDGVRVTAGPTPAATAPTGSSRAIDLTPVHDGTGRARLLDLVPGRSAAALATWLAAQTATFRDQVEVVAMDGFGGYKTAAADQLPDATAVIDPFHVVALAGTKLDLTRQRVQQQTLGHQGRTGDPLYGVRRTLRTRLHLLSTRQQSRLTRVRRQPPRRPRDLEHLPADHSGECGADQRVGFVVGAGVAGAGGDGAGQRLCGVERGHPDRVVNELRTSGEIASVIRGTAHPDRNHADGG